MTVALNKSRKLKQRAICHNYMTKLQDKKIDILYK